MSSTPPNGNRPTNRFGAPPNNSGDNSQASPPPPAAGTSAPTSMPGGRFGAPSGPAPGAGAVPPPSPVAPTLPASSIPPGGRFGQQPVVPPVSAPPVQPTVPPGSYTPPVSYTSPASPSVIPSVASGYGRSAPPSSLRVWVPVALLVCLIGAAAIFVSNKIGWGKSVLSPTEIAEKAKPATVLIYADFGATVEMPEVTFDTDKLKERVSEMESRGQISADAPESEKLTAVVDLLFSDPGAYLVSGASTRKSTAKISAAGSGFILTPDGYIVTCAHVVEPGKDVLDHELINTLQTWFEADIKQFTQIVPRLLPGSSLNDAGMERLTEALKKFYKANMQIGPVDTKVYAVLGSGKSDSSNPPEKKPCDVKVVGKPTPGKDVAILKVYGSNLPTLPLARNLSVSGLRTGEALHVYGYPGVATFNRNFSPSSIAEPSMTNGSVSRITTMQEGWKVIQTDAPATHGNSGGPVLNDAGEVVGILTFGAIDPNTGESVQGFNFIMPSDIIREFTNQANIPDASR